MLFGLFASRRLGSFGNRSVMPEPSTDAGLRIRALKNVAPLEETSAGISAKLIAHIGEMETVTKQMENNEPCGGETSLRQDVG